jgi:excisionase family DNA binding protein
VEHRTPTVGYVKALTEEETRMKILTVKETADALKVKPQRVYNMMRNDGLPCIRLGRQVRIDEDSLKKWLTAHRCVR